MQSHRHGDLCRTGGAARALYHHWHHGWWNHVECCQRWLGPILVWRRDRCAGGYGLCVLWRNARYCVGQYLSNSSLLAVWRHRNLCNRGGDGGISPRGKPDVVFTRTGAIVNSRTDLTTLLFQLHFYSLIGNRLSPHSDLLSHREKDEPVQKDRHLLSAVHHGDLATVRVPRGH